MPTYQYACKQCDHRFEAVQSFSDASLTDCPECDGQGQLRKLFGSVGVIFKGSGFYRNDARSGAKTGSSTSADASSKSSSSSSDKSSSSTSTSASTSSSSASGSSSSSSTSSSAPAAKAS